MKQGKRDGRKETGKQRGSQRNRMKDKRRIMDSTGKQTKRNDEI